ncbi:MAG: NAD(P)H-binding protein [Bacteroidota bacterium]
MKAIIAGSTGMVGSLVLANCLASEEIDEVVTLMRRPNAIPVGQAVKEVVVTDFTDYSSQAEHFQNVGIAFFCIGVYTGQVKDDQFKVITVDYAVAFAKALQQHSPDARLCLLSGAGADRTEKSRVSFARYKGMAENQLAQLGLEFYSFRPGYIYPVSPRKEPNLMYRVSRWMYPLIRLFGKNASIKSTELAQGMFQVGLQGAEQEVLENRDILAIISA